MSYENTHCPCGGAKECSTMLCPSCIAAFQHRPELTTYQDTTKDVEIRRQAAMILLELSHGRVKGRNRQ